MLLRRVDAGLPIETLQAWSMILGALALHVISLGLGESVAVVRWTAAAILALGYLVVVASAFGFLVYFDHLERLAAIEINLVSYAAPVAAAATGFLFLGEVPTRLAASGFVLILLGFVLIKRDAIRLGLSRLGR